MTTETPIRFGTDGWRGIIADDFTFVNVRRAAGATGEYIRRHEGSKTALLVGYDRRFLSPDFAREAARVLQEQGFSVSLTQSPMTTPSMSVNVVEQKASWGIMITASHNPALYNGFKLKDRFGRSAPPEATAQIE